MSATNNANQSQVNLVAVFQAAHDISQQLNVDKLVEIGLSALLNLSKAQSGVVVLSDNKEFMIAAITSERSPDLLLAQRIPLAGFEPSKNFPVICHLYNWSGSSIVFFRCLIIYVINLSTGQKIKNRTAKLPEILAQYGL